MRGFACLPLLWLVFACHAAQAGDASSIFLVSDRNPMLQFHGPPPVLGADTAPPGAWRSAWTLELTNDAMRQETDRESLVIDGELWRLEMNLRYGVREGFELGLSLPLLAHRGGIMDEPIWEWHELFGLSNNKRRPFAHNRLQYTYVRGGERMVDLRNETGGIGDVALTAGWRLWRDEAAGRAIGLQAAVELPTGDEDRLLGSGTTDLSVIVTGADARMLESWRARLVWRAGFLVPGSGGLLDAQRRDWVPLAGAGVERPVTGRFSLKAQLDAHGAWYDSDLSAFADHAVQLTVGAGIAFARGRLDIAIIEDLVNDPTPDFGWYLAWRGRP